MRTLNRNKVKLYYATLSGISEKKDENDFSIGYEKTYSAPVAIFANVSAARGKAEADIFGIDIQYDKAIVIDDMDCPIDESSILWIDKAPDSTYVATSPKHDYIVTRVSKSLNSISYAVSKVITS